LNDANLTNINTNEHGKNMVNKPKGEIKL